MSKPLAAFMALLLAVLPCIAQQPSKLLVPAGTALSAILTGQISSTDTHPGDLLHAQLVSPVVVGSQIAIPAGTYLQGRVSKVTQQDDRVQVELRSASLAFANGYVAQLPGLVTVRSANGWWRPAPNSHRGAALLPFLAAPAAGTLIGLAAGKNGTLTPGSFTPNGQLIPASMTPPTRGRDAGIGLAIGVGVMAIGLLALHAAGHHGAPDFFFPAGAPVDVVLVAPISLDAAQVAASSLIPEPIQPAAQLPVPAPAPNISASLCPAPDTPGTPDTIIPGVPATPDFPGTPDIVIPGTPSIPGGMVPCN
jgi:hypothetical protein